MLTDYKFKTSYNLVLPALLKHEDYWDSPFEFIPERFDARESGYMPVNQYAYIPFSVGRR